MVAKKSLSDQLAREKEFDTPDPLFICSGQTKPFFNTGGNTAKYNYSWAPSSLFTGFFNIKNAKFTTTYPKGALSTGNFQSTLKISEKTNGCTFSKTMRTIIYPPPNPDFGNLQFCQNTLSEVTVRVFVPNGYTLKFGTLNISPSPIDINLYKTDFTKIPSSQLIPNTLGEVTPPNRSGRQISNENILIDVAKISINTSQVEANIPITFTMVTDSGCTATVTSSYSVGNVYPAPIIMKEKNQLKSNFEIGNQWYMNGQLLKDSIKQYITPIANGTCTAKYINGECTSNMSDPFDFVLGAEEGLLPSDALQLYPNPTNNLLYIKTAFSIDRIVVYQSNGKIVMESKAGESVDVEGLSEGLYMLEVWDTNNRRVLKKFEKR